VTTIYQNAIAQYLGSKVLAAAQAHAREQFPKESCGFVARGKYVACQNQAADPLADFRIEDPRLEKAITAGSLKAIIHSHPNGPIYPSEKDMAQQLATDVPWFIIPLNEDVILDTIGWGDQLPIAPIVGRPFIHGIFDCYAVMRDAYRLGKDKLCEQHIDWPFDPIELPNVARGDGWWRESDRDLYQDGLSKYGFKIISRAEAQPGDVFLMRFGDHRGNPLNKLNHGGVLLNRGEILHHLPGRASRREQAAMWVRAADLWIRYEGTAK
jgi:proteasome lid subunit RPN8/RPN11